MVKVKLGVIIMTLILVIMVGNKVYATDSFRSYIDYESYDGYTINQQAILYATRTLQRLGYINSGGTDQYTATRYSSDVRNYINQSGNNYGLVVFAHGLENDYNSIFFNTDNTGGVTRNSLEASQVTGNWHLVLLNTCYVCGNDTFPNAFKTVGYSNRATIGFNNDVSFIDARNYWRGFNNLAGNDSLGNINDYLNNLIGTQALVYGDWQWNGYAW